MNNSVLKKALRAERARCPSPPSPPLALESHECALLLSGKGRSLTVSSGKPGQPTWATSAETPTGESGAAPHRGAPSKHSCSPELSHQLEANTDNKRIKIPSSPKQRKKT